MRPENERSPGRINGAAIRREEVSSSIAGPSTGTVIVQVFFPRGKRPLLPAISKLAARHDGEITIDDDGPPRNLFLSFKSEQGAEGFLGAIPRGAPLIVGNVFFLGDGS